MVINELISGIVVVSGAVSNNSDLAIQKDDVYRLFAEDGKDIDDSIKINVETKDVISVTEFLQNGDTLKLMFPETGTRFDTAKVVITREMDGQSGVHVVVKLQNPDISTLTVSPDHEYGDLPVNWDDTTFVMDTPSSYVYYLTLESTGFEMGNVAMDFVPTFEENHYIEPGQTKAHLKVPQLSDYPWKAIFWVDENGNWIQSLGNNNAEVDLPQGNYTVAVYYESEAGEQDQYYFPFTVSESVNNEGPSQDKVNVYPNPATDFVTLDLDEGEQYNYTIYSMDGKEVLSSPELVSGNVKLDISRFKPGTYFLLYTNTDGTQKSQKFVKN